MPNNTNICHLPLGRSSSYVIYIYIIIEKQGEKRPRTNKLISPVPKIGMRPLLCEGDLSQVNGRLLH